MKVVILAGGMGTRLSEETSVRPKPMVEIGGRPILWHIMKLYATQGFHEFILCLGYKGYQIKEYFMNYFIHSSDVTVNLQTNEVELHHCTAEPWKVTLVDTGAETQTGGRLARIQKYLNDEPFLMTYGDGLSNVRLKNLLEEHQLHSGAVATMTVVQPLGRFGAVELDSLGLIHRFHEKPQGDGGWINGGFFVLEPSVFEYIQGDMEPFEGEPLRQLAEHKVLFAYRHKGFWHPMDTLRDKTLLNQLWNSGNAPWRIWE